MIYDFDTLPDRKSTESIKWNYFEEDVLPMWVADMDFVSPEPVVKALRERVEHGVFGYAMDVPGLKDLIVERMVRLYGWEIQPDQIVYTPGVVTGFHMAAHGLVGADGGMLIQTPVYMPFLDTAKNARSIDQQMELTRRADGSYEIDWDCFEQAFTEQTRMFLLCNPHNPVGRVYTRAELERMAEISLRRDVIICSDEIHSDLIYEGHHHVPLASISPEIAQKTITLMAPSKTFNVAGLSASFAIIPNRDLRKQFIKGGLGMVHGVNLLGLVAAKAAYAGGQEWLDQLMAYLQANRDYLYDFANTRLPGVKMFRPEGTYLAWLDCREANIPGKPGDFFTKVARVGVVDGGEFGKGGQGFIRLNFGCPRSMLQEALERMEGALKELR